MFHLTYPQLHISVCLDSNLRKWNSMFFFFSVFLNTVISITEWLTLSRTHGGWGQSHRISLRGIGDCFGGYWVTLQSQRLHSCTDADISAALLNALLCLAVLSLCQTVASQETSKVCLCRLYPILIYSLISQKGRSKKKRSFPIITQTIKQTKLSLIWNCFTLFLNEEQRYHVSHLVCAMCTHTVDGHNKLTKPLNIYGCTSKWYPWVKANKKHANFLLLDCSKMPFHKLLRL